MYCKKCGCKVTEKEKKCPNCGRSVEIEYCGGFWGLVGEEKKQSEGCQNKNTDTISSEVVVKKEKQEEGDTATEKEYKKILIAKKILNKKYKKLKKRSGICIGVLIIALILQSVSMVTVINEKENIETKYESLSNNYELGKIKYKKLKEQYKSINIKVKYKQIQLERLKRKYEASTETEDTGEAEEDTGESYIEPDENISDFIRNTYEEIKEQIEYMVNWGKQKYKEGVVLGKEILKNSEKIRMGEMGGYT